MVVIVVPFIAYQHLGDSNSIWQVAQERDLTLSLLPDWSKQSLFSVVSMALGWGIGYFGQPHILNKFMAIKETSELVKAKWLSTSWQILALTSSASAGLVALAFFAEPVTNGELIFIDMVKVLFNPFLSGLILCAIFLVSRLR